MLAALLAFVSAALGTVAIAELAAVRPRGSARRSAARGGSALRVAARIGRAVGVPGAPRTLADRIAATGMAPRVSAADVMAVKVGGAVTAACAAFVLAPGAGRTHLLLVAASAGTAFGLPDLVLARRRRARVLQAGLELPAVLDLLRIAVEAGLPVSRAVAEVGRRGSGLVPEELGRVARQAALGADRDAALSQLARRLPLPEVAVLIAALRRAERHGSPLAEALAALALDARSSRARALQDHAARTAPKIQLAVALLLVPAVLLLVAAVVVNTVL